VVKVYLFNFLKNRAILDPMLFKMKTLGKMDVLNPVLQSRITSTISYNATRYMPNKFILQICAGQPCSSSNDRLTLFLVGRRIPCNNKEVNGFFEKDCPVLKTAEKNQTLSN